MSNCVRTERGRCGKRRGEVGRDEGKVREVYLNLP